jgi:hypothetical protein
MVGRDSVPSQRRGGRFALFPYFYWLNELRMNDVQFRMLEILATDAHVKQVAENNDIEAEVLLYDRLFKNKALPMEYLLNRKHLGNCVLGVHQDLVLDFFNELDNGNFIFKVKDNHLINCYSLSSYGKETYIREKYNRDEIAKKQKQADELYKAQLDNIKKQEWIKVSAIVTAIATGLYTLFAGISLYQSLHPKELKSPKCEQKQAIDSLKPTPKISVPQTLSQKHP